MFKPGTVLVLGAGASYSDKLLGSELRSKIGTLVDIQRDEFGRLQLHNRNQSILLDTAKLVSRSNENEILAAARKIARGLPLTPSIDSFLELKKNDALIALVAKVAIVIFVHELELSCAELRGGKSWSHREKPTDFEGHWYRDFAEVCFGGVTLDDLPSYLATFSVISFNYDRCFEQFLRIAVERLYDVDSASANELVQKINIQYPYGSLGDLPSRAGRSVLEFGIENSIGYAGVAQQINTFSDGAKAGGVHVAVRSTIAEASNVIFLDFGFHRINIDLLKPDAISRKLKIFGTAYNMPDENRSSVESMLTKAFRKRTNSREDIHPNSAPYVKLEKMNCGELLRNYRDSFIA